MNPQNLKNLERILGHTFEDKSLLKQALTHASATQDKSYERLEFLGDRILGAVVADLMYHHYPDEPEGSLAKRFNRLVCGETLSKIALNIGLDKYIVMAKGEQSSGGRHKKSLLADVCESTIAALYLDGDMKAATQFIMNYWSPLLEIMEYPPVDPKSELQELSQSMGKGTPVYTHLLTKGPDHAPTFTVEAHLEGYPKQSAEGSSKRIGEQKAAHKLLILMKDTS